MAKKITNPALSAMREAAGAEPARARVWMGNRLTRTHLVNAATVLLSATKTFSSLKDWGVRLAKKVGFNKAKIAVARKLATIMFGIWRDGTHFQFKAETVVPHRQMMQAARG